MGEIIYLKDRLGGSNVGEVTIFDIAKAFLSVEAMTHKKLQKLCYYAQAWHLVLFRERLFNEKFEAWIHGPVCPSLYNDYKEFGWKDIPREEFVPEILNGDEEKIEFVNQVYRIYGKLDGDQLEDLTHSEEPWQKARQGVNPWEPSKNTLDEKIMLEFYTKIFEEAQHD